MSLERVLFAFVIVLALTLMPALCSYLLGGNISEKDSFLVKFAKKHEIWVLSDLAYLMELGAVVVTTEEEKVVNVRLSASGIDLYEQIALRKYEF